MAFGLQYLINGMLAPDFTAPPESKISDAIPNIPMTNQFGEPISFRDQFVRPGKALVINTVYTTCKGSCPGTSAAIETLRKKLSPVFGDSLSFLSFTVEPHVDTPKVLKTYAGFYGAGERNEKLCDWYFLRASKPDTDRLRRSLGLFDLDPRIDRDVSEHASLLVVGNLDSDRWCSLPAELRIPTLIESIRRIAGFTFEQRYGISK